MNNILDEIRPQEWRPAAQGKATSAMQVAAGFWTFEKKAEQLAKRGRGVVNEKATSLQVRSQNYLALSLCSSSILGHCLYHMALFLKTCSMWMCCCQRFSCDYNCFSCFFKWAPSKFSFMPSLSFCYILFTPSYTTTRHAPSKAFPWRRWWLSLYHKRKMPRARRCAVAVERSCHWTHTMSKTCIVIWQDFEKRTLIIDTWARIGLDWLAKQETNL